MNGILNACDRISNTPFPLAYSITSTQICYVWIAILPFQLIDKFKWYSIPAIGFAAYMVLSLQAITHELENPFGNHVNDLPLEMYCDEIANNIDIVISRPPPAAVQFIRTVDNMPLYPQYLNGYHEWSQRSVDEIFDALKVKIHDTMPGPNNSPNHVDLSTTMGPTHV
jgi:putative membrane protein